MKTWLLTINVVHKLTTSQFKPVSKNKFLMSSRMYLRDSVSLKAGTTLNFNRPWSQYSNSQEYPKLLEEKLRTKWISSQRRCFRESFNTNIVTWMLSKNLVKCIGPKDLNPAIKRPDFQMPTVNDILPKISKIKLLTVVDAKEDFWHGKPDKKFHLVTKL